MHRTTTQGARSLTRRKRPATAEIGAFRLTRPGSSHRELFPPLLEFIGDLVSQSPVDLVRGEQRRANCEEEADINARAQPDALERAGGLRLVGGVTVQPEQPE